MSNDPMGDFMRKQRKREDKAFKNLWHQQNQAPRQQRPINSQKRSASGYKQPQQRRHSEEITVNHKHYYPPGMDPYLDDAIDDGYYLPPYYNRGMDWQMFKLFIIIFGGLLFFGVLWMGGLSYVQEKTPIAPAIGATFQTALQTCSLGEFSIPQGDVIGSRFVATSNTKADIFRKDAGGNCKVNFSDMALISTGEVVSNIVCFYDSGQLTPRVCDVK